MKLVKKILVNIVTLVLVFSLTIPSVYAIGGTSDEKEKINLVTEDPFSDEEITIDPIGTSTSRSMAVVEDVMSFDEWFRTSGYSEYEVCTYKVSTRSKHKEFEYYNEKTVYDCSKDVVDTSVIEAYDYYVSSTHWTDSDYVLGYDKYATRKLVTGKKEVEYQSGSRTEYNPYGGWGSWKTDYLYETDLRDRDHQYRYKYYKRKYTKNRYRRYKLVCKGNNWFTSTTTTYSLYSSSSCEGNRSKDYSRSGYEYKIAKSTPSGYRIYNTDYTTSCNVSDPWNWNFKGNTETSSYYTSAPSGYPYRTSSSKSYYRYRYRTSYQVPIYSKKWVYDNTWRVDNPADGYIVHQRKYQYKHRTPVYGTKKIYKSFTSLTTANSEGYSLENERTVKDISGTYWATRVGLYPTGSTRNVYGDWSSWVVTTNYTEADKSDVRNVSKDCVTHIIKGGNTSVFIALADVEFEYDKYYEKETDSTPPVLSLKGLNPYNLTVGNEYREYGVTCDDAISGDCSDGVRREFFKIGTGNNRELLDSSYDISSNPGQYVVKYTGYDNKLNNAFIERTINIDNYMTLTGGKTVVSKYTYRVLPVCTFVSGQGRHECNDDPIIKEVSKDRYKVTFKNNYDSNNDNIVDKVYQVEWNFVVIDEPPLIELDFGDNDQGDVIVINPGDQYRLPECTVLDDNYLNLECTITGHIMGTSIEGTFPYTYTTSDGVNEVSRTIELIIKENPSSLGLSLTKKFVTSKILIGGTKLVFDLTSLMYESGKVVEDLLQDVFNHVVNIMRVGEGSSTSLEPVQVYSDYTVEEYKELCASVYPPLQQVLQQYNGQQSVKKLSQVDESEMRYLVDNITLYEKKFIGRIKYAFGGIFKGLAEDIILPW